MKTKKYIKLLFIMLILIIGCSEDENPVAPTQIAPDSRIFGPNEEDYDFYVGITYSDPQPTDPSFKRFYVIIAKEDSSQGFSNVMLKVQSQDIFLEAVNYDGTDFYIGYFNIAHADTFDLELSVNGKIVSSLVEVVDEIEITLPQSITPQEDLKLNWAMKKNPQVHYVEAIQIGSNNVFLTQSIKNLDPAIREFTIPSSWLWNNSQSTSRIVQIGTMNYTISERVCFTIADEVFKLY